MLEVRAGGPGPRRHAAFKISTDRCNMGNELGFSPCHTELNADSRHGLATAAGQARTPQDNEWRQQKKVNVYKVSLQRQGTTVSRRSRVNDGKQR